MDSISYNLSDLTVSPFEAYSSSQSPVITRVGYVCQLSGALKCTSNITVQYDAVKVCDIPAGFRPVKSMQVLRQASGYDKYLLEVRSDGLFVSRYGASAQTDITPGSWLVTSAVYLTSDPMPS